MKRIYIIVYTLLTVVFTFAQQRVSSSIPPNAFFYNSNWRGVPSMAQAAYYRVLGRDDAGRKMFYDYYITGQLKAEKHYITISKQNDHSTVLDGVCRTFFKSGRVESIMQYKRGVAHGRAVSFYPSGNVGMKLNYRNGVLNGSTFTYNENGKIENTTVWNNGKMISQSSGGRDSYIDKTTNVDMFCNRYKSDEALIMEQSRNIANARKASERTITQISNNKYNTNNHSSILKEEETSNQAISNNGIVSNVKYPKTSASDISNNDNIIGNNKTKEFSFSYLYAILSNIQHQTNNIQFYDDIAMNYYLNIAQTINGYGAYKELIYHYNMDYDEVSGSDKVVGSSPRQLGFWGMVTNNQLTVQRINIFTWSKNEMLNFANEAFKIGYQVLGGGDYLFMDGNFVLEPKKVAKQAGVNQVVISFIHKGNVYAGLYHIQMDIK